MERHKVPTTAGRGMLEDVPAPRSPFGTRLEQEMLRIGATQQRFAQLVGVSQQTVSKWITGETTPRIRLLPKIEQLLEVPIGTLSSLLFAPPEAPGSAVDGKPKVSLAGLQRKLNSLTADEIAEVDLYIDRIFHNRS